MKTDLVVANQNGLAEPDSNESVARIEAMAEELPALIEASDNETLKQWRNEGNAAGLAAKRLGYQKEARALMAQALRCCAALGVIAGHADNMPGPQRTRMKVAGLSSTMSSNYRVLGAAMERGRFESVLELCGGEVSESRALQVCRERGLASVSRKQFARLIRQRASERHLAMTELCRQAGFPSNRLEVVANRGTETLNWWTVYHIAKALELEIGHLPPCPRRRRKTSYRAKWLTHKFRLGDGRWDEAGVRFVRLRDEMHRADPQWVNKPLLYEAMQTVVRVIEQEIRGTEAPDIKPPRGKPAPGCKCKKALAGVEGQCSYCGKQIVG